MLKYYAILLCFVSSNALTALMMSYQIEALPDSFASLGEGPHWDIPRQSLYFVDIVAGLLLRYDYSANKVYRGKIDGEDNVGFVLPIQGSTNEFAVGCLRRVLLVNWDGVSPTVKVIRTLFDVQPGERFNQNRFNDAKCDPRGRLFAGTMRYVGDEFAQRLGELYRWEKGGRVEVVKTDVGISNGLAWNETIKKFYYIDTADFEVKAYDYNPDTGAISNPKVIFNLRNMNGNDNLLPDGMTIDTEGNLYVATFNGHTIYKINPNTGKILLEIKFPTKQITSATFGGPNLDILYVTTAAILNQPSPAGTTYRVTGLNARGLPNVNLRI